MNSKQRLLKSLRGGKADKVPVSFFIQEVFTTYYFNNKNRDNRVDDAYEVAKELDLDIQLRPNSFKQLPYDLSSNNWKVNAISSKEKQKEIKEVKISTPEGMLIEKTINIGINEYKNFTSISKKLINNENEFKIFKKYFPYNYLDNNKLKIENLINHALNLLGDDGIVIPWTSGGIYNSASNFLKEDAFLMMPYINFGLYSEVMDLFLELNIEYSRYFADCDCEFVGVEGNIANGRVVSKKYFEDFIFPYEKKFISELKNNGTNVLYHNCGYLGDLLDCYLDMGIDAWETLTPYPYADVNIGEIKKKVMGRIGLMGGFDQIKLLKKGSLEEIIIEANRILKEGKPGGGYVFGGSDWLEEETPIENIKYLIEYVRKNGMYL